MYINTVTKLFKTLCVFRSRSARHSLKKAISILYTQVYFICRNDMIGEKLTLLVTYIQRSIKLCIMYYLRRELLS